MHARIRSSAGIDEEDFTGHRAERRELYIKKSSSQRASEASPP
jgi:hypothetical protein